jgi:hypothetical protein
MAYGESFEEQGVQRIYNSFITMNLGGGLWVTVPNITAVNLRGRERRLFNFSLDRNPEPKTVRIVGNYVRPNGRVEPEPTEGRLANDGFTPSEGYILSLNEHPRVLIRTFNKTLEPAPGNVLALQAERQEAKDDGWLCRVSEDVRNVLPQAEVMGIVHTGSNRPRI